MGTCVKRTVFQLCLLLVDNLGDLECTPKIRDGPQCVMLVSVVS